MEKKRYVQVGIGGRARFFYEGIAKSFADNVELTGFCDINRKGVDYAYEVLKEKYNYPLPKFYGADVGKRITVYPMLGEPYNVPLEEGIGGHGGGDPVLLNDLFNPDAPYDELNRAASHIDGVYSIMIGICANKSIETGLPINIKDMIDIPKEK